MHKFARFFKPLFKLGTLKLVRFSSDTIFALSSGQGKCGVAVIRISGSNAQNALKSVTTFKNLPKPRTALLRSIIDPQTREVLDKGLVLWFPGPKSFTGEDCFELHVHGGLAVINAVLKALKSVPKLRLAEPGEFTRRAFYNAKLDLTEVEGLADLLQAETEAQRKQAFLQTQGSLSNFYKKWKINLTRSVARIEAQIDFEETDTIETNILKTVESEVDKLNRDIEKHLSDGRKGEILRNGVKTVILGEPNVGKSSLLNILCHRQVAIVTPVEGTTRDVLEVTLNINGYPLVLADTAGLRSDTTDIIEKEGINRALKLYEYADLVLLVIDLKKYLKWTNNNKITDFSLYLKEYLQKLGLTNLFDQNKNTFSKNCILVLNKVDLAENKVSGLQIANLVKVSCLTEVGISELVSNISDQLKVLCGEPSSEHPSMNQTRHRQELLQCSRYLKSFLKEIHKDPSAVDLVLVAEHLRKALKHLGKLVGSVTNDQLLDVIFKEFCIGK